MVKWLRRLRSKHMKMCLIHSKGLDILTNPYDLVLEYDRETKAITKRIEFTWYNYGYDVPNYYPPQPIHYDEYANQFTPHLLVRKKWNMVGVQEQHEGKYEGNFDSIKVGDVITDEMIAAASRLPINESARMKDYVELKSKVEFYQLLGGVMPDMKIFLANAWFYGYISEMQVRNAVGKMFIKPEDVEDILAIQK